MQSFYYFQLSAIFQQRYSKQHLGVFTAHNLTTIKMSKIILIKLFNSLVIERYCY